VPWTRRASIGTSKVVDWVLRPAVPTDVDVAGEMLAAEGLPTEDLSLDRLAIVAEISGRVAGVVGLEQSDGLGLLRSLVVEKNNRGSGLGDRLVAALEERARQRGLKELWLLTIDADRWFGARGYEMRERDSAPQAIRETKEFAGLCPGDAVLMMKDLGP